MKFRLPARGHEAAGSKSAVAKIGGSACSQHVARPVNMGVFAKPTARSGLGSTTASEENARTHFDHLQNDDG